MTSATRSRLAGLLAVLALPLAVGAQAPAAPPTAPAVLPAASAVIKHYVTAVGGEAAIRKHTSRTMKGSFQIAAQGMKGDLVIVAEAPDHMTLSVSLEGLGSLERGYDGHVGWSIDPAVGPRLLQGRELDELRYSADFYDDLHDPSRFQSMTVVSRGPFEGQDCYAMKVVRTSGFEYTEYFSVATGLLAGVQMDTTSQMGTVPVTTVVSQYREFGGVKLPTTTHQRMMGLESVMTIDSVSYAPVAPDAFALPPQIRALIRPQP